MFNRNRPRWNDNDKHFGPFTVSYDKSWKPITAVVETGGDEYRYCRLRFGLFGIALMVYLPRIIRPWRIWVDTSQYSWSNNSGGYWDIYPREYGISLSDGFLQVFLGPQTNDSITTKAWSWFLPWTQWRHVRYSLYDLTGNLWWTASGVDWEERMKKEDTCPSAVFRFKDFDGEELTARTYIEEREWRFGEGWFKWLSVFRKPRIVRSLNLNFSGETGTGKGSWKGGTVGHSIDMVPGELHEQAFKRYCSQEHRSRHGEYRITFLGKAGTTESGV